MPSSAAMEKPKSTDSAAASLPPEGDLAFICTECGEGFCHFPNMLKHMASHGPLESFPLDGSSNGFEVPREYVLHENGMLTIVGGFEPPPPHAPGKPALPPALPTQVPPSAKPVSPAVPSRSSPPRDASKPKPTYANLTLNKDHQGHYRCEICNKSFGSRRGLNHHQQYRNTERGYKCTLCCTVFGSREDLKKHLQDHARKRFLCCGQCGKRFLRADALDTHDRENHQSLKGLSAQGRPQVNQEKVLEKMYPCKKCELSFFWMSDFQIHTQYHCRGNEPGRHLASGNDLTSRKKKPEETLHDKNRNGPSSNGPSVDVKGSDNGAVKGPGNLADHEESATAYRCGLCGDHFQRLSALKDHHLTHQTQEEMDTLNQESQTPVKRKVNKTQMIGRKKKRRSSPGGKLYACKQCPRVFNHSSSLSRHMRYHKGTMHTCVVCHKAFSERCAVRRHMAMNHKSELEKKPWLKQLPPQGSVVPADSQTQDGNPPVFEHGERKRQRRGKPASKARVSYECQECEKKFGLLSVYQRHLRYHKKELANSHKCPKCPAHFKTSSGLLEHLENHPDTDDTDTGQASDTAGARQEDTAGARQEDTAGARQEDTAGARQEDTAGARQEDTAGARQEDTAGARQEDTAGARQEDTAGARQEDTAGARQEDTAGARQEDTAGARQEDTAGARQEDTAGARQEDTAGARQEDTAGARQEDTAGARQEDTAGARQEDTAGARQEDTAGARQEDTAGARQEDTAGARQEDTAGARQQDTGLEKDNLERTESNDVTTNTGSVEGNAADAHYKCTECTRTFSSSESFLEHQSSHGGAENCG